MEKNGQIREGNTPPEDDNDGEKRADSQTNRGTTGHVAKRLVDQVKDAKAKQPKP